MTFFPAGGKFFHLIGSINMIFPAYTKSKLAQILNVEYYTKIELPPSESPTSPLFYGIIPGPVKTSKGSLFL